MKCLHLFLLVPFLLLSSCQEPADYGKAQLAELKAQATEGNTEAQFKLGDSYYKGLTVSVNNQEAFRWFMEAAKKNHPKAQNRIGMMYHNGITVKKDYQEARRWFEKSAFQGLPEAQFNLAIMLDGTHEGIPRDDARMNQLLVQAADQDHAAAQYSLGELHALSNNLVEAYKWACLATDRKERGANTLKINLEKKMTPYQMEEGRQLAKAFKESIKSRDNDLLKTQPPAVPQAP